MVTRIGLLTSPEATVGAHLNDGDILCFEFDHQQDYLGGPPLRLTVFVETDTMRCIFTPTPPTPNLIAGGCTLADIARILARPVVDLRAPLPLAGLPIDKPWGQEIWFTGIEARGVCTAAGVPLPWLLDCFPEAIAGQSQADAPILLKILSPFPDEDLGDLYFEAHARKTEVYIVTEIDREAWPNGVGKIRFGFDPQRRREVISDDAFRSAYLEAVSRYRAIRDRIDRALPDNPAPNIEARRDDLQRIDPELRKEERQLRMEMESFYESHDLRVGDVVRVPPLTPHSLQHGVTVVEFQTPHYERFILSFSQKVLTQPHWDTEQAMELIHLDVTDPIDRNASKEHIAEFGSFSVLRLSIGPGEQRHIPRPNANYALVMCITGEITLKHQTIRAGASVYVPANCPIVMDNHQPTSALIIIAMPGINLAADP